MAESILRDMWVLFLFCFLIHVHCFSCGCDTDACEEPGLLRDVVNTLDVLCNFAWVRRERFGWDVATGKYAKMWWGQVRCNHQGAVRLGRPVLCDSSLWLLPSEASCPVTRLCVVELGRTVPWSDWCNHLERSYSMTKRVCILLQISKICLLKQGIKM